MLKSSLTNGVIGVRSFCLMAGERGTFGDIVGFAWGGDLRVVMVIGVTGACWHTCWSKTRCRNPHRHQPNLFNNFMSRAMYVPRSLLTKGAIGARILCLLAGERTTCGSFVGLTRSGD